MSAAAKLERCVKSGRGVRYVVEGDVYSVSLTWQNDMGGTEQGEYDLPFCVPFYGFTSGDFLYISAQINQLTSRPGDIKCRIYDGAQLVSEARAHGTVEIATCSGSAR